MASAHEIAIHLVTVVKSKNSTIPFILLTSIMVSVIFFANIAIPPRNNISLLQSRLFPATIPGNSDPVGDEWPMFHGQLNHSGVATTTPLQRTGVFWIYSTGGIVGASVAIANGYAFFGSTDDNLYCLNASTGTSVWNYSAGGWVVSSPAVAGNHVYVGSHDHKIYCLNATTGTLIWNFTTDGVVISSPAISGDRVYEGGGTNAPGNATLYCLNATTGALIWSEIMGNYVYSSPAVAGGRVFVGSYDHKVHCLNATTGTSVWNYTTSENVESSPAVAGGSVYVGSDDSKVYCLNATTGTSTWNYTTGNSVLSSPAVVDGRVYVGSEDNKTYCLNATTGVRIWDYTMGSWVYSSPAVASGFVYVGDYDHKVYCLNATTGGLVWNYITGDNVFSSPAVADGRVYVGSFDHKLYCFPMILISNQPSSPQGLQALRDNERVTLIWQVPVTHGESAITNYRIYMGTTPGNETLLQTIGNVTTCTVTGLTNVTGTYYFKVTAVNAAGESFPSSEAFALPLNQLPMLTLLFALLKQSFNNPVQLTITISCENWPAARAWCVIDNSSTYILPRINGTAESGIYSVSLNLALGSHVLMFFVNDTHGNMNSQVITITVIASTPSSNGTMMIIIIAMIAVGMSLGIAIPVSYTRHKNRVINRKPSKSKASTYTQLTSSVASEMSQPAVKRSSLLNSAMPTARAELPTLDTKVSQRCTLHKGLISGPSYKCKHCGAIYCKSCITQLVEAQESCWSCSNTIALNEISIATPTNETRAGSRGKLTFFEPDVINKIHELGIQDDMIPDVLELLKDVPEEDQMQYLVNLLKET